MTDTLLDHPPVVVRRRRRDEMIFLVAGAVAVIVATGFATQLPFRFVALPLAGIGAATLLLGIVQRLRPTMLVLEPAGLHYSILGITRVWSWADISGFRVVRIRSGSAIMFDVAHSPSRTFAIPGFFAMRPIPLAGLLQEAQARWATGGPCEPSIR